MKSTDTKVTTMNTLHGLCVAMATQPGVFRSQIKVAKLFVFDGVSQSTIDYIDDAILNLQEYRREHPKHKLEEFWIVDGGMWSVMRIYAHIRQYHPTDDPTRRWTIDHAKARDLIRCHRAEPLFSVVDPKYMRHMFHQQLYADKIPTRHGEMYTPSYDNSEDDDRNDIGHPVFDVDGGPFERHRPYPHQVPVIDKTIRPPRRVIL